MAETDSNDPTDDNKDDDESNAGEGSSLSLEENKKEIDALVKAQVEAQLKDIKGKLDNAYNARDDAIKKAVNFEEEKKAAEITRLEEEGKHSEAATLKMTELQAKLEARDKQITALTRDNAVRDSLKSLSFRNETAADFAYKHVVENLTQEESGNWVHKTGISIKDFIKTFEADDDKSFLFQPKRSSGTGKEETSSNSGGMKKPLKSFAEMTTEEMMEAAKNGQIASDNRWL